ncbi:MAG: acylneuraminate cytidylyltransferase, partial [Candidatus Omnitrophica bacterium]|nr:acylneuraminate cytidylyltransferase [Candidatus Omnitrophota bacterium]
VVSHAVRIYRGNNASVPYVTNCCRRTFPRGLDVEVVSFAALETAFHEAKTVSDREHVTPFIMRQPDRFPRIDILDTEDHSDLRLTVDTIDDFRLVAKIYEYLYPQKPDFGYTDILELFRDHPELKQINAHVRQKEIG